MAVQGSQSGVAAVVLVNDTAKLYFYGKCNSDYCGADTKEGAWTEISTGLSADKLSNVAQIDMNAYELVLHFMNGEIAVSNTHGLCGLEAWTPTAAVQGFFSTNSLQDGYAGYVLKSGNL